MRRPPILRLLLLGLLAAPGARAEDVIINSKSPYWQVGDRDKDLSRACSMGRFNERERHRYVIELNGKKPGAQVLGVAKGTGLNLWDPDHHGVETEDYFFLNDGTSNCSVFVGGRNGVNPKLNAPAPNGAAPAAPQQAPAAGGTPPPAS